jgi:hypothetical protein
MAQLTGIYCSWMSVSMETYDADRINYSTSYQLAVRDPVAYVECISYTDNNWLTGPLL